MFLSTTKGRSPVGPRPGGGAPPRLINRRLTRSFTRVSQPTKEKTGYEVQPIGRARSGQDGRARRAGSRRDSAARHGQEEAPDGGGHRGRYVRERDKDRRRGCGGPAQIRG